MKIVGDVAAEDELLRAGLTLEDESGSFAGQSTFSRVELGGLRDC
jgi:hypothetical protein